MARWTIERRVQLLAGTMAVAVAVVLAIAAYRQVRTLTAGSAEIRVARRVRDFAEILNRGHLVCIDTYCWGGGWLTALDVSTGQIWQADRNGRLRPDPQPLQPSKPA